MSCRSRPIRTKSYLQRELVRAGHKFLVKYINWISFNITIDSSLLCVYRTYIVVDTTYIEFLGNNIYTIFQS